jgi:hypothetical protein
LAGLYKALNKQIMIIWLPSIAIIKITIIFWILSMPSTIYDFIFSAIHLKTWISSSIKEGHQIKSIILPVRRSFQWKSKKLLSFHRDEGIEEFFRSDILELKATKIWWS